ncbi:MAG: helix-turn-helix domain-containing protein [Archangium sp.]|nr:helix-turn-helix domain-containing protein [Archangium sp.]
MKSFQAQTHYEVLEISVGATLAEIRAAHERLTLLYGDDQVALYGLIDPARAAALRVRLQEAFEVLTDDQRREAYDLKIGLPPRVVVKPPAPPKPAPSGQASAGTGWGGSIAWVTPSAPAQPAAPPGAYTYAVTPTRPVASPAPMLVVPVPARILAVAPAPAPVKSPAPPPPVAPPPAPVVAPPAPVVAPLPPEPPLEPRQLALDVPAGVPSWGARPVAPPPSPPAPAPAPEPAVAAAVEAPPTPVEAAPPPVEAPPAPEPEALPATPAPEPEKPAPVPAGEPPVAALSDDVEVAIVPARATPSREFKVEQRPRPYEIPEGVEINGDLLKQVRLAKGLSLVQVADRTRIGVKHLENVEGDRYDALPAAVYLRGILMNLARELGLDGLRVSRSYLTFVEAHRSKG